MKVEEINALVASYENSQADYYRKAKQWEKMWRLEAFEENRDEALRDGREQVTLPDPYNVVQLATRLFSTIPAITCPSEDVTKEKDESAQIRQKFLSALWHRASRELRRDVIKEAAMFGLIRGRFAFDLRWIGKSIPEAQKKRRMPFLLRTLDPYNVGERRGPIGPRWAYHRYDETFPNIVQHWPDARNRVTRSKHVKAKLEEDDELQVVDFWWMQDGKVWNAVTVEDKYLKEPVETDYPDIPIVCGFADYSPVGGEAYRGMSILHPMNGLWQYNCRLASQMGTGVLWYFWPAITVENEFGQEVPDLELRPGTTTPLPPGTKVDSIRFEPNVPIASMMQQQLSSAQQQSTFPGVLYGQAPGDVQAGYAINILSEAARGRISDLVFQMQQAMMTVNEIALGLVEKMATSEGIAIWGYDEAKDDVVHVGIKPKDIDGYLENKVKITLNVPNDDMGKKAMGLQEVDKGLISHNYYRQNYSTHPVPADEEKRVLLEQAMRHPQLQERVMEIMLREYLPEEDYYSVTGQAPPDEGVPAPVEVPKYQMAQGPNTCAACKFAQGGICTLYQFRYDPDFTCASWTAPEGLAGPMGLQSPGVMPGMNQIGSPAEQGQITPGAMGMNPNAAPGPYQAAMGQPMPTPETMAQRMRGGRGSAE